MFFDFDKFSSITASVYADSPYSLAEVLEVFRYYFEQYEAYTGAPHPPIRAVQIERIIREMPYIDETDKANSTMDIYCATQAPSPSGNTSATPVGEERTAASTRARSLS